MISDFRVRSLAALIIGLWLSPVAATCAESANAGKPAGQATANPDLARMKGLFSDLPEYAAAVPMAPGMKTPPRLVAGNPPASPGFLEFGKKVLVMVCVAINEQGGVAAARILKSEDARCDPLAIDAIVKWKFAPATNGTAPIKCVVQLPVEFVAPPPGAGRLEVQLGAFAYDVRGLSLHAPVQLKTTDLASIKGARITVTRAVDDTGADLKGNGSATFFHPSVGRISDEGLAATKLPMPSINLRTPDKSATQLSVLEGSLELVMPGVDPMATANISQVSQKLGVPVVSNELAAAHVRVTVFDKAACIHALADQHDPADLRGFLWDFTLPPVPGLKPPFSPEDMTDTDIALAIDDPEGRLVDTEFQMIYGAPVVYEHNGWAHFEKTAGKRFSLYRLREKITDEIKLVCWLATDRSTMRQNFNYTAVPLPAHR